MTPGTQRGNPALLRSRCLTGANWIPLPWRICRLPARCSKGNARSEDQPRPAPGALLPVPCPGSHAAGPLRATTARPLGVHEGLSCLRLPRKSQPCTLVRPAPPAIRACQIAASTWRPWTPPSRSQEPAQHSLREVRRLPHEWHSEEESKGTYGFVRQNCRTQQRPTKTRRLICLFRIITISRWQNPLLLHKDSNARRIALRNNSCRCAESCSKSGLRTFLRRRSLADLPRPHVWPLRPSQIV